MGLRRMLRCAVLEKGIFFVLCNYRGKKRVYIRERTFRIKKEVKRMEDSRIVALYEARREEAVSESAAKYGVYCTSIAFHILRQAEDSEECVSDTWLRAWNAIPPDRPVRLRAYLGKITRNLALNRYRQEHARKRGGGMVAVTLSELRDCVAEGCGLEEAVLERELGDAVNRFVAGLSTQKRTAFILRYYHLLTVREIAARMELRESTVKSILLRLRKQLKSHLEQEGIFYET